jgi:hypothetical protein
MKALIRLTWEALFLCKEPYTEMRETPNPALRGLGLVALVSLIVAVAGLVGTALEWATSPNLQDIQQTVLEGLQAMPWYKQLQYEPGFVEGFLRSYDIGWRIFPRLFGAPDLVSAALRIILLPLGLAIIWVLYGAVAHLFARLMGGQGGLAQMLGCTALAVAPQLLNLATFLPYVGVGAVVGTWTLLCRYVALKTCHRLTWGRALAATLLPYAALDLVLASFACLGVVLAAMIFGGGTGQ